MKPIGATIFACSRSIVLLSVLFVLMAAQVAPLSAGRIALVVGNSKYENLSAAQQLKSPKHDAREIARALKILGYKVYRASRHEDAGINVTRKRFYRLWTRFKKTIEPGDVVLFYYSGHGLASEGSNFLIPGDIDELPGGDIEDTTDFLKKNAISLGGLIGEFQRTSKKLERKGRNGRRGGAHGIFIVDACRNAPTSSDGRKSFGGALSGMAPVRHPTGIFVMYSAELGQTSLDRLGHNDANPYSLYTRKLLPFLTEKYAILNLSDLAQILRVQVYNEALRKLNKRGVVVGHRQSPAYYDGLLTRRTILGDEPPDIKAAPLVDQLWKGLKPGVRTAKQFSQRTN